MNSGLAMLIVVLGSFVPNTHAQDESRMALVDILSDFTYWLVEIEQVSLSNETMRELVLEYVDWLEDK